MARRRVKLNTAGIRGRLNDPDVREALADLAEKAAAHVEAQGIRVGDRDGGASEYDLPVAIESQATDRAREVVVLDHPAGLSVEAKHGALVKAASALGLEVKSKP